jgi:hypothetical protein
MNGMMFIDVMTQPGHGPLGGSIDTTFRDAALNARNPFTPVKGTERLHQYGLSISGPIRPGRSSFSVTAQAGRMREGGVLLAALPGQTQAEATVQPINRSMLLVRFDQSVGTTHLLRGSFSRTANERRNLGVGGFDLSDRAYATSGSEQTFRLSENGPIGRRAFSESRLQMRWTRSRSTASLEQPTIRVLDAFTAGGAQQAGGRRDFDVEAASDLDLVRGSHSYRVGVLLEARRYRSDARTNYRGTFTFSSLADYQAGRPSNYARRIGDPVVELSTADVGAYVQDDYRVLRSLLVSYGLRYETQSFMSDRQNWSPRVTATWAPWRSGRTTLRLGWGRFTDWIGPGTHEQSMLVDGTRFQEINITNPTYPNPGATGAARPSNRYVLDTDLALPESYGLNLGVSQTMGEFHLSATYARRQAWGVLRGRNLNPLIGGMRADPRFGDIVSAATDAGFGAHSLMVDASVGKPRWHRLFANANYGWSDGRTNTTGAFSRSPSNDVHTEWGPTAPRHRFGFNLSARLVRTLGISINIRGQSGAPFNVTSGQDSNGDGVFNDRPDGIGRNSARGAGHFDMGARLSYAFGFGGPARGGGGGPGIFIVRDGPGGSMPGGFDGGAETSRLRLEIYASAQNVTNHRNYVGYSGVQTSPFFGEPTNILNPRKVEL